MVNKKEEKVPGIMVLFAILTSMNFILGFTLSYITKNTNPRLSFIFKLGSSLGIMIFILSVIIYIATYYA